MNPQKFWQPRLAGIPPTYNNTNISIKILEALLTPHLDGISNTDQESNSLEDLEEFLELHSHASYSIRAIHLCQPDSWSSLRINSACLDKLTQHHGVMPEFSLIASMFVFKRNAVEEAFCGSILQRELEDTLELSYVLKYPESKASLADGDETWVIRQLGVYQQYSKFTKRSVWILLRCQPDSKAQQLVTQLLNDLDGAISAQLYPVVLHLVLLSCYIHNWRNYMSFYEMEVLKMTNKALGARLEDLPQISHETIARLHFLETKFSALPSIFASLKSLFTVLEAKMLDTLPAGSPYRTQLASYASLVDSCSANVKVLLRRCSSLTQFIVDSIGVKNQVNAQTQSELMLRMNEVMVKDSTSIKVITVVTLVYLPASFVATFFGMQFFQLSPKSLWMFFGLATLLTVLTMLGWLWSLRLMRTRSPLLVSDPEEN